MHIDSDDPRIRNARPGWALVVLGAPIALFALVVMAYTTLVGLGLRGRAAGGEQVTLHFEACSAARAVVEARLGEMGLDDAQLTDGPDGFDVAVTMPTDPDVATTVPSTLAAPGHLEVRHGPDVLATQDDLRDAGVRLDVFMIPSTLLRLDETTSERITGWVTDNPEAQLRFLLDGELIGTQNASNPVGYGELEIETHGLSDRERMNASAAWAVILDHGPLPCAVTASRR